MKKIDFIKLFFWFFIFFWIIVLFGTSLTYLSARDEKKPLWVIIDELKNFHEPKVKFYKLEKPIFLYFNGSEFFSISAICTFRRAILEYKENENVLFCPVHGEKFDLNGNPLNKKLKTLKKYQVRIKGGKIYVLIE
ncbi:MAG: Rieske 2Fe-2S domain-containing protein [candidate division WOR-3 bacterium]